MSFIRYINSQHFPVLPVAAGSLIGFSSPQNGPLFIGALIDEFGLSPALSGSVLAIEISAIGIGAAIWATQASFLTGRILVLLGAVAFIAGQCLSIIAASTVALIAARTIVGIACGAIYTATNICASRASNPDRTLGVAVAVTMAIYAVTMPVIGFSINLAGADGAFYGYIGLIVVLLPFLLRLHGSAPKGIETKAIRFPRSLLIILLLSVIFLNIAQGAAWMFSERVGQNLGLSSAHIGAIMGVGTAAGVVGSASAGWLGVRWGRTLPMVAGFSGVGCACLLLNTASAPWSFVFAVTAYWIVYMFSYPYILGTGAEADPTGKTAAIVGAALLFSMGIGPLVGGFMSTFTSPGTLGWSALALCLIAACLLIPVTRYLSLTRSHP